MLQLYCTFWPEKMDLYWGIFFIFYFFCQAFYGGGERRWRAVVQRQLGSQSKHANGKEEVQKVKE
jgi:hypothetical protein